MKYFSDLTGKIYNTEAECMKAEQAFNFELEQKKKAEEEKRLAEKKKQEERAADAKVVEQKREAMIQAQNDYRAAVEAFVKKHGSYHFSTNSADGLPHLFTSFFDFLQ
jgi:hypothetical protein